jgi:hypothetical protein
VGRVRSGVRLRADGPKDDFEDLFEFRKFYRARLPEGSADGSEEQAKKG